jgi:hypothetical protein
MSRNFYFEGRGRRQYISNEEFIKGFIKLGILALGAAINNSRGTKKERRARRAAERERDEEESACEDVKRERDEEQKRREKHVIVPLQISNICNP